jgi:hypothetical protein
MSLCSDQKTFNKAVRKAIEHIDDEDETDQSNGLVVKLIVSLIMISFYLWALLLALKVSDKEHRVLHVTLALLTGPLYVLSYYLGTMKQENMMMME